jgi:hypothetical protein
MAAFEVGVKGGIAAGSCGAVGAGILTGMAVGAQSYFLGSILSIATGAMSPRDLSTEGFVFSVGLGMAFGAVGGKHYDPKTYWPVRNPLWPKSAEEMDDLLGFKGVGQADVPGTYPPGTPGRGKVTYSNPGSESGQDENHDRRGAAPVLARRYTREAAMALAC